MAKKEREWRYEIEGVGKVFSVTEVLKHAKLSNSYANVPAHIMEAAGARGTAIHTVMEELCIGKEVDETMLDENWLGYLEAGKRWVDAAKPAPIEMETLLWCETDRVGGRMDFFGKVGDDFCVIDFKTRAPDPVDALQTAGYQHLLVLHYLRQKNYDLAGQARDALRCVVSLGKDGRVKTKRYEDNNDLNLFLAAAKLTWWRWENGRL